MAEPPEPNETDHDDPVKVVTSWSLGTPLSARTVDVIIDHSGYALAPNGVDDLIARLTAAPEKTWPAPGPVTRRECPLPSCSWHHDEPDWPLSLALMPMPNIEQLEEARRFFGHAEADPLRDANLANLLINTQRLEGTLRKHFQTHPLEEWVLEVVRLQQQLANHGADSSGNNEHQHGGTS